MAGSLTGTQLILPDTREGQDRPRVELHPWDGRRDRRAQNAWPASSDPFAEIWQLARPSIGPRQSWAIRLPESRATIGRVSLRDIDDERRARIGIYLSPAWCGRGLGRAALAQLQHIAFSVLELRELRLDVAAGNRRAVACYQALGFCVVEHEWRVIPPISALGLLAVEPYSALSFAFQPHRLGGPAALFFEMVRSA